MVPMGILNETKPTFLRLRLKGGSQGFDQPLFPLICGGNRTPLPFETKATAR